MLFARYIRFNPYRYDLTQMNKKYKELSKKNFNEENQNIKDYNVIVDSIMSLTGSYINKKTFDQIPADSAHRIPLFSSDHSDFYHNQLRYVQEKIDSIPQISRIPSQILYDPQNDIKIPKPSRSLGNEYSMQIPTLSQNKSINESNYEPRKKLKPNENIQENKFDRDLQNTTLQQSNSTYQISYNGNTVEDFNFLPNLHMNRQMSNFSIPDDLNFPSLNKYNSVLSLKFDR